jgi:hypothetical protein
MMELKKVIFTLFISLVFAVLLVGFQKEYVESNRSELNLNKNSTNEVSEATTSAKTEEKVDLNYTIVQSNEIDLGYELRQEVWVVPHNIFLTEEEIQSIASDIIEKTKEQQKFQALDVFFIDDQRQIHNGFTIARVSYEREGKNVSIGDYTHYIKTSQMGSAESELLPRDYAKGTYPTKNEIDMYFYWLSLVKGGESEQKAIEKTAEHYGLTSDKAEQLIEKAKKR